MAPSLTILARFNHACAQWLFALHSILKHPFAIKKSRAATMTRDCKRDSMSIQTGQPNGGRSQ
jgi:hypothetical protein